MKVRRRMFNQVTSYIATGVAVTLLFPSTRQIKAGNDGSDEIDNTGQTRTVTQRSELTIPPCLDERPKAKKEIEKQITALAEQRSRQEIARREAAQRQQKVAWEAEQSSLQAWEAELRWRQEQQRCLHSPTKLGRVVD